MLKKPFLHINEETLALSHLSRSFEKSYGLSFVEVQTKVPELKLSRRQDQNERKNERRQNYRKIKTVIEDKWKNTIERSLFFVIEFNIFMSHFFELILYHI